MAAKKKQLPPTGLSSQARWKWWVAQLQDHRRWHRKTPPGPDTHLGRWLAAQQRAARKGRLSKEKVRRLQVLGLEWSPEDEAWNQMLQKLRAFKSEHGHCQVPSAWPQNPALPRWVGKQLAQHEAGELRNDRRRELERIGLLSEGSRRSRQEERWTERLAELAQFMERHGHCNIPRDWPENPTLAKWAWRHRAENYRGRLRPDRKERLEQLGFAWRVENEHLKNLWELRFNELLAFTERFGHTRVPAKWEENIPLGHWRHIQRAFRRQGKLSPERIARLNAIGFEWAEPNSHGKTRDEIWPELWETMFAQLGQFKERHGHCNVPKVWPENPVLGEWVSRQRTRHRQGSLLPGRKERLEQLGFRWQSDHAPQKQYWVDRFAEMDAFQQRFGHTRVPDRWAENPRLAHWRHTMRRQRRTGKLSPEQIARLDAIGFDWEEPGSSGKTRQESLEELWDTLLQQFRQFREQHGHASIPRDWPENPNLAKWAWRQRAQNYKGRLRPDRKERLDQLGFVWRVENMLRKEGWERRYGELLAFKERFGHTRVPAQWKENRGLGHWHYNQRAFRRKSQLSAERIARLDALGFEWGELHRPSPLHAENLTRRWDENYQQLRQFKERHGHCRVPTRWPENPALAKWVMHQRTHHNHDRLPPERKARLEELGFTWRSENVWRKGRWERRFRELLAFKERFGHTRVPAQWKEDRGLGHWHYNQRHFRRKGQLSAERIARLDALGFEWEEGQQLSPFHAENLARRWNERFEQLRQFKARHGHCHVPCDWEENQALANWVQKQRADYRAGKLVPERHRRLNELNFDQQGTGRSGR